MAKSKRREIVKERHRQEIIQSALYLFGKKGYKDTTIDEIAEQAQFSKGAIYFYFKSKKHLFNEILKSLFDKVQSFADKAKNLKGNAREKLKSYMVDLMNYFLFENKYSYHVMMQAVMQMGVEEKKATINYVMERVNQINKTLTEIIKLDLKNGKLRKIDPSFVVMALNGILRDVIYDCSLKGVNLNPEEVADTILTIIFDGISKTKNN